MERKEIIQKILQKYLNKPENMVEVYAQCYEEDTDFREILLDHFYSFYMMGFEDCREKAINILEDLFKDDEFEDF